MSKNSAGKGDAYRPVNKELYDKNYDRIFGGKGMRRPKNRDECDLGRVKGIKCSSSIQIGCASCTIGRIKKNEDDRCSDDSKEQVSKKDDVLGSAETDTS